MKLKKAASARRPDPSAGVLRGLAFGRARDSILVLELPPSGVPVIRAANPAALALHGFSRQALLGRPVTVLGAALGRGDQAASGGGSPVFEVRQRRADGSPLVTEVTTRSARLGGTSYAVVVERDVTGRLLLEEEGRRTAGRIMLAREEEKKRLAASLHDAVGALHVGLSSALLLLEQDLRRGRRKAALARIEEARGTLKGMTARLKAACVESWPPALGVAGLAACLKELLADFEARTGAAVSASVGLKDGGRASKSPLAIVLYRLAQEALRNAEKHAGARNLEFSVAREDGWLTLRVRDDGRGFDTARAGGRHSLGLKMMAEAAASAGGYFAVYSRPGRGTTVKAELPLRGKGRP